MTHFNPKIFTQAAAAMLGTLILTTTAITAAVGPAMAVEAAPGTNAEMPVAGSASA